MAKFERRKRVEFKGYDAKWADSYVILAIVSFDVAMAFDRERRALGRQVDKLEEIEEKTDEQVEALENLNEKFRSLLLDLIAKQLREGKIYDDEQNQLVDLVKEDLGQFDFEVLNQLVDVILGKLSAKKK